MQPVDRDALQAWLLYGRRGISSNAMAAVLCGQPPDPRNAAFGNHPRDPSDFARCHGLIEAVPGARERLPEIAALSDVWSRLVDHWDELEALLHEERPTGRAPKLYARMKELGC